MGTKHRKSSFHRTRYAAFTMAELLVSLALMALLASMLFPGLRGAREQIRRVVCANNLKQWGVALAAYRQDSFDYLPTEGTFWNLDKPGTWFNALPPYLDLPAYVDVKRFDEAIKEFPALSTWICPAKNRTNAYKSRSGRNQFHYAMNQVLDGLGAAPDGSADTPGFPDQGEKPLGAHLFRDYSDTVFMIEIAWNSPAGTPRDVATEFQRDFRGNRVGKFHGDYANVLYLNGAVGHMTTDDLVNHRDFRHGDIRWNRAGFYWGYTPPRK